MTALLILGMSLLSFLGNPAAVLAEKLDKPDEARSGIIPASPSAHFRLVGGVVLERGEIKPWDLNQDGKIDGLDLKIVTDDFHKQGEGLTADIDQNGIVDVMDLVLVAGQMDQPAVKANRLQAEVAAPWDVNGDLKVDILDLVLVAKQFGEAGTGATDVNADGGVNIVDLVFVAQHFGEEIVPRLEAGKPIGIGEYSGRSIGFFGSASGTVSRTNEGALTVEARLVREGFASWGFDFDSSVNVKNQVLVIQIKGPQGAQFRLQFRDQKWHDAGRFGQVQAKSQTITLTGDWQEIEIDLSQITENGIDFSQLKHIAIEYGTQFFPKNPVGLTLQLGDTSKDLAAFLFTEKASPVPARPVWVVAPAEIDKGGGSFQWQKDSAAAKYHVQILKIGQTIPVRDLTVTGNIYTPNLEKGNYQIRIAGINADGKEGAWVEHSFNVVEGVSLTPQATLDWIDHLTRKTGTGLPTSFEIPQKFAPEVLAGMAAGDRVISNEGLVVYDGAVADVARIAAGNLSNVGTLTDVLWRGSLGALRELRAYFVPNDPAHPFLYSNNPADVSKGVEGSRGYFFAIVDAEGKFNTVDPATGNAVQWQDWRPISGENAWAGVIAPLQSYFQKHGDAPVADSTELRLAEEIARVALLLQAENGGIRMAPRGTFHPRGMDFLYNLQSVENNLSWYASFRMLYQMTGDQKYKEAMDKLEGFFQSAFNRSSGTFVTGKKFSGGQWIDDGNFATDVQMWAILVLGVDTVDQWFGEGTALRVLEETKKQSGVFDGPALQGFDFTNYRRLGRSAIVSVEWTAFSAFAFEEAANFYSAARPDAAQSLLKDVQSMDAYLATLAVDVNGATAYPYATGSGAMSSRPTGLGWDVPPQEVLSLSASSWMVLRKLGFNPFLLGGK